MTGESTCLSTARCWELLAEQEFGRLAYIVDGHLGITPVNYVTDTAGQGARIVFRTARGSKLAGVLAGDEVLFEIDQVDEETATSVVVRGRAREIAGGELRSVEQLPLRPWLGGAKPHLIEIVPHEVTGRAFALCRPWRHMRLATDAAPRDPRT